MNKNLCMLLVTFQLALSFLVIAKPVSALTPDSWATKTSMNVARNDLGVAVVNDKIYAIGGNTENGYMPNSEGNDYRAEGWIAAANEEYDLTVDKWSSTRI